jgi:outer membrane receptor protein involved in Fe transport
MSVRTYVLALVLWPALLSAQQPGADTTRHHAHGDSLPRPVQLQEITVTAAPARRDEPASAVQLSPAVIQRASAINPYELLRQTAGLEVHDQGQGPGFASDASVRGFSSDHSTDLALWVDGVPINEPVNGHAEGYNDWNVLFPQSVSSIDVFKGPTSALYGNFGLAGVVNVRTLERAGVTRGELSGGGYGRLDASLLTGYDKEDDGGVLGFRFEREGGWRPNSEFRLGQAHGRLVHQISPSSTFDAGLELYATGWNSPGFLTLDQFDRRVFDTVSNFTDGGYKHRAQERVSLRVAGSGNVLWRSTVYATQGRWQLFLTTPPEGGGGEGTGSQTEEEDKRYGFGATTALTWSLPRLELTVGGETRWDHSDYQNWFTTDRFRDSAQTLVVARQASAGLFLQSVSDLGRHFRVSLGGRYDALGTRSTAAGGSTLGDTKGIFSPKLGMLYHLPSLPVDLYGNVSRGFRQTDGVIEDPSLPFITAWAYETGLKLDQGRVHASVALFRMDVSNEQTFDPLTLASTSGGRSRRQGVELGVQTPLGGNLTLRADWTINDAKYRSFQPDSATNLAGFRVFNTARHVGSASIDLAPPAAIWNVQLATNVVGPYSPFDEPGVELPSYALLHASGGVRIGTTLLQIGVRNLTNHMYPEVRAGGFVVPAQPRSVYGTVRYLF